MAKKRLAALESVFAGALDNFKRRTGIWETHLMGVEDMFDMQADDCWKFVAAGNDGDEGGEEPDEDEEEEKKEEKEDKVEMSRFVESQLTKAGVIFISQVIDDKLSTAVMAKLLAFEQADREKTITVVINSPGGSADSGFGIYDMMKFVKNPIRAICAGLCASAGVLVYLGADKGKRYSLLHSRFMIHQPSTASQGQASDLEITAREIVKTREKAYELIALETGISIDKIKQDSRRDFWLSAKEAVEYKLVDKIVAVSDEW